MNPGLERDARRRLAGASLRRTQPRVAVLAALLEARRPLSQEEIAGHLRERAPNKVTIYRALEALLRADLVHRAFLRGRTWRFELADHCAKQQCHPHFTCTGCGEITCLQSIHAPLVARRHRGFVVHRQRIELEGLCPACEARGR
jgi:Fur family ferric uptake transcriptional regulator